MSESSALVDAYLARLPGGLDAYPTYFAKATVARSVIDFWPRIRDHAAAVPPPVRALIEAPPPPSIWIPEVYSQALWLLALERCCGDDHAAFDQLSFAINEQLLSQPIYRTVFRLLGARLTIRAITTAWSSFHRGIELTATMREDDGDLVMSGPPHLQPPELASSYGAAYCAALHVGGLSNPTSSVLGTSDTEIRLRLAWQKKA